MTQLTDEQMNELVAKGARMFELEQAIRVKYWTLRESGPNAWGSNGYMNKPQEFAAEMFRDVIDAFKIPSANEVSHVPEDILPLSGVIGDPT